MFIKLFYYSLFIVSLFLPYSCLRSPPTIEKMCLCFHFSYCYYLSVCTTYTLILFYLTRNPQRNRSLFASKNILKHTHFPSDGRCCLDTIISHLLLLWAFLLYYPHSTPTANTSDWDSHFCQAYSFDYSNALWYSVLLHYIDIHSHITKARRKNFTFSAFPIK